MVPVMAGNQHICEQLNRVLRSRAFRAAGGLRNLLAFVVEETMAGRGDELKEYVLGARVLRKGASFDPKLDPIVRVQMRRLRDRLRQYYTTEGRHDPIVIDLQKGRYVPMIEDHTESADDDGAQQPGDSQRTPWADLSAYELDLRARYLLSLRSVTHVREAAAVVEEVLQRYPSFAPAYATLAECYRTLTVLEMMPPSEVLPKMKAACSAALKLDGNSAEAHSAYAGVLAWEWDFTGAEKEHQLAVTYGPQSARVHMRYAVHLAAFHRFDEAIECASRACELDPLSGACAHAHGVAHYWNRDYVHALEWAQRAVDVAPQFGLGHHLLGFVSLHTGDYQRAIDALEQATSLSGASTFDRGYQAFGYGCAGEPAEARRILSELVASGQRQYVAPLSVAHCYLGLREYNEALLWIERAYRRGAGQWPYYLSAPFYDPLLQYPRFQSVVARIGLPRSRAVT
jgi:tetratricopeptide (TPR) repeat protein